MKSKKIHFIGIGGIGISALARYYVSQGWDVSGSDQVESSVTEELREAGIEITIGENSKNVSMKYEVGSTRKTAKPSSFVPNTSYSIEKIVYTEAIMDPDGNLQTTRQKHPELDAAMSLDIPTLSYPEALGEVFNKRFGIAVTGTHGKSTTTSLLGLIWKKNMGGTIIAGTKIPQFGNTNFFTQPAANGGEGAMIIEACEYKRHFLNYHPEISIITNIELDHLDYFKDEEDYIEAFRQFQNQTQRVTILSGDDPGCQKLKDESKVQVWVYDDHFEITGPEEKGEVRSEESDSGDWGLVSGNLYKFPNIELKVPGKHILRDAHLAYIVGKLLQVPEEFLVKALESYSGAWRRMEVVGQTSGGNTLMSDYGHHPTEIELTLPAIQERYPDKHLYVIFQPHQYSRTIELLEGFKTCFDDVDTLVISDIYYSRDKQEDVDAMPPEKLVEELRERYPDTIDGQGLENTAKIIKEHDRENDGVIYLLLGAGDVDNLRYKLLG